MTDSITLQFSTTSLWQSGVIRLASRSKFSHVDVVVPAGFPGLEALTPKPYGLLGASDPGGVMIRAPNYHAFKSARRMTLTSNGPGEADEFIKAIASKIGETFDHGALYRTFDQNLTNWDVDASWICVELMTWGLLEIGYWDYEPHPVIMNLNSCTPEDLIKWLRGRYDPVQWNQEVT
jgi:hypothetical protein